MKTRSAATVFVLCLRHTLRLFRPRDLVKSTHASFDSSNFPHKISLSSTKLSPTTLAFHRPYLNGCDSFRPAVTLAHQDRWAIITYRRSIIIIIIIISLISCSNMLSANTSVALCYLQIIVLLSDIFVRNNSCCFLTSKKGFEAGWK